MFPINYAIAIGIFGVVAVIAVIVALESSGGPMRPLAQSSSEASSVEPTRDEERVKRAMSFTVPAEPAK